MSANRLIVVWVTTPSENSAKAIAAALVEQRLAACATITPAYSVYRWQGAVEHAQEWQLSIKTHRERLTALQALVHRLHSYDVPEILALPILGGSPRYLSWLAAQVT
ncbi:MAG: divalent-cation tolerance protein CutA [Elainellaceae cyanobacterium]